MTRHALTSIIVILVLTLSSSGSGQSLIVKKSGAKDSLQRFSSNSEVAQVVQRGRVLSTSSASRNERIDVIVEFTAPAATSMKGNSGAARSAAAQQGSLVASILSKFSGANVSRRFSELINAVALSATRADLNELAAMTGVKRIHEDKKVAAFAVRPPVA